MPTALVKAMADKTGKPEMEVERLWKKAKVVAKSEYPDIPEDDDRFYAVVVGILKQMIGVGRNPKQEDAGITTSNIGNMGPGPIAAMYKRNTDTEKKFKQKKNKKKPVVIYDPPLAEKK